MVTYLSDRGWLVEVTNGNMYQIGFPDLFVCHPKHGQRWVEVKNPKHYTFTPGQRTKWPKWEKFGVGIWILTAADEENYRKLFGPPNWREFWKAGWEPLDIQKIVRELNEQRDQA